jgi:transmembrane sensor
MQTLREILKIVSQRELTGEENQQLLILLKETAEEETRSAFTQALQSMQYAGSMGEQIKAGIIESIVSTDLKSRANIPSTRPVHRVHFLKTAWFRYAAAFVIIFGAGAYLWNTQTNIGEAITATDQKSSNIKVHPGSDRAILTLSNGQRIELNAGTSETINDGNLTIRHSGNRLIYQSPDPIHHPSKSGDPALVTNTMTTPKGGQYQLYLPDGSRVWLNAASSITFPVVFTKPTREVSITGEVYFEVATDKTKPFLVKTNQETITVLGTSFNVNSYQDEVFKTSLAEGAIKIDNKILKPGQAYLETKIISTDLQKDLAWKNGFFNFDDMSLAGMLRQLSRWYDIEIVYENKVPEIVLEGRLRRDSKLNEVLKILKVLKIKYSVEGKKLIIK